MEIFHVFHSHMTNLARPSAPAVLQQEFTYFNDWYSAALKAGLVVEGSRTQLKVVRPVARAQILHAKLLGNADQSDDERDQLVSWLGGVAQLERVLTREHAAYQRWRNSRLGGGRLQ